MSQYEPLPGKIQLPEGWTFHKLELKVSRGASGQIRLMYLVNTSDCVIKLVWIYNHEQFEKRPADKDLKKICDMLSAIAALSKMIAFINLCSRFIPATAKRRSPKF